MSTIQNLEHSMTVVHDLGVKADDSLENKKEEVKVAGGGVIAANEIVRIHEEFLEKNKKDLEEKTKEGKLTPEFVAAVLNICKSSHEVIKKFMNDKTAVYNIRRGEAFALEAHVKSLKEAHDKLSTDKTSIEEAKKAAEAARIAEQETIAQQQLEAKKAVENPAVETQSSKDAPGRKKRRPDEAPHVKSTVDRLKESRKNKKKVQ